MAYSIDYIKRAVAYKQEGHTFKQLREAFGIPIENPDAYLYELAELFECSSPAVFYALEKLGITLKKDLYLT